MPSMAPLATPPTQPTKLVKEVRQLGCETFSSIMDAVVVKNWLKKVSDILIDMELDDELKLRVVTRLLKKCHDMVGKTEALFHYFCDLELLCV